MSTEAASRADFSAIRYAQVWEDADILLRGLDIQPGDTCLSIASAGDNALALLTRNPARVYAVDLNPAQLACLELRVAAYRQLDHAALLELVGSRPSARRAELYARLRGALDGPARAFWDARPGLVEAGIGSAGRFERYFATFRRHVLPLIHGERTVDALLRGGDRAARLGFYEQRWDTWRWRLLFTLFFSRFVMGRLGRDPAFFNYVEGGVAARIMARARHALTELDPAENPYLQWILRGSHTTALPCALRPEHFAVIRANLDRLAWRCATVEDFLATVPPRSIHRFNLSDIFEYMSPENATALFERIAAAAAPGGRLAYWNMLAPRSRPASLAGRLRPLPETAATLHREDKAFFYSAYVLDEVLP